MAEATMTGRVVKGRFAGKIEGDFVVFLIGMRINHLHKVHKWMPVARSMPRMLAELKEHPELGLLHAESYLSGRTVMTVQYWRSFEALHAYAHTKTGIHLAAWAEFNRRVGGNGSVGIFHESYLVKAGAYECVYANTPPMGLAKAGEMVPATGRMESARARLNRDGSD